MLLRTTLALWIFLFTFSGADYLAEARTNAKTQTDKKKWVRVDGFRSAKFGLDEKKVMRAIVKDFKISKSKVKRNVHPGQKTVNISVTIPKLMAAGGTASVNYILGFESKKLIQVNVIWGASATKKVDPEELVSVANLLRGHFIKKKYRKEGYITNGVMNETMTIVFRGMDKKNRMILLTLTNPKVKKGEDQLSLMSLKLSYILDYENPDILSIKEGEF